MSDLQITSRWYALHVKSRHEKFVTAQLEAKQYNVFLPLYRTTRKWADRWKSVSLPLFPGYVFCHFEAAARSGVMATSGLIDVVRIGADPAPVETSEIEAVRLIVNSTLEPEPYPKLVKGQRVEMSGGPLSGLSGILMEVRNGLRLVVSVELLHRSVMVEIEREWVRACEPEQPNRKSRPLGPNPTSLNRISAN